MKLHLIITFVLLGLIATANAEQMTPSRTAFVGSGNQEMIVADGTAWKINTLPARFCSLGQQCPAIIIDGEFKVGDRGETRVGKVGISYQQLGGEPLWIMAGAKVIVPVGASNIMVQEFVTSLAAAKESIPVSVTFRDSAMGNGLVTIYTNRSSQPLILYVTVQSARKTFRLDLPPYGARELGHLEGWAFRHGDIVTITVPGHDEYEPMNVQI